MSFGNSKHHIFRRTLFTASRHEKHNFKAASVTAKQPSACASPLISTYGDVEEQRPPVAWTASQSAVITYQLNGGPRVSPVSEWKRAAAASGPRHSCHCCHDVVTPPPVSRRSSLPSAKKVTTNSNVRAAFACRTDYACPLQYLFITCSPTKHETSCIVRWTLHRGVYCLLRPTFLLGGVSPLRCILS